MYSGNSISLVQGFLNTMLCKECIDPVTYIYYPVWARLRKFWVRLSLPTSMIVHLAWAVMAFLWLDSRQWVIYTFLCEHIWKT